MKIKTRRTPEQIANKDEEPIPVPAGSKVDKFQTQKDLRTEDELALDKLYRDEVKWREAQVAKVFREGRGRTGAPTRITEQVIKDLEVLARIGLAQIAMAKSIGVAETTLIQWMKRDTELSKRVKIAREKGKAVLVNSIYGHGRKNWQATAWLLERMYRSEFALDKHKVEVTGQGGKAIIFKVEYEKLPTEVKE